MSLMPRRRTTDFDADANAWIAQVKRLELKVAALKALQDAARGLTSELNLDELLAQSLRIAVDVMQAGAGSLLLYDPATKELVFRVVQGGSGDALLNRRFPYDQGIAGSVFISGQPCIVDDVEKDHRYFRIGQGRGFSTNSLIAAPLVYKNDPIGVIEVLNKKSGELFTEEDQELLVAFAAQSAVAIENARLYQQVVAERDRILVVEDQVRRELARDLHDGPSQLLSAIVMSLRFLREVIARKPENAQEELASIEQIATQAIHQVRNMLFNLRPVLLETQGLGPALKSYVARQSDGREPLMHLEMDTFAGRLSPKAEAAIFSIVQEAVSNVRKHANAKNIWITLCDDDGSLDIAVEDDGCGFDVEGTEAAYAQRGSLGLLNVKERAEIANGKLVIHSEVGRGTTVRLVVPLDPPATAG